MDSSAAGQLLGYSLQFPRALVHLLQSSEGDIVSVECLGDVARELVDGEVVSEEDKSSVSSNPVTDKSTDLWKTFYNWIQAVQNEELKLDKTRFVLYSNHSGRESIASKFSEANNTKLVDEAIDFAKLKLKDVDEKHEIWKYSNFVLNENLSILKKLLLRFELLVEVGAGFESVRGEIKKKHVPDSQIDFVEQTICGWLQKNIMEKIREGKDARVPWEDFDKQMKLLLERVRTRELIDFALVSPPHRLEVEGQIKIRPRYVRQLDIIGVDDSEIVEAVTNFLRADINRNKWIEADIIDESIAEDFEEKLVNFWKNTNKRISITNKNETPEEKGVLLLGECQNRQETIRGETPPSSTIAGTYHALANNEDLIGWHPNWKEILGNKDDE